MVIHAEQQAARIAAGGPEVDRRFAAIGADFQRAAEAGGRDRGVVERATFCRVQKAFDGVDVDREVHGAGLSADPTTRYSSGL